MAEVIFAEGIRTFEKRLTAPEWVICDMVIDVEQFSEWLKAHPEYITEYNGRKQIKLQMARSKDGRRVNVTVNTFVPKPKVVDEYGQTESTELVSGEKEWRVPDKEDDLPF